MAPIETPSVSVLHRGLRGLGGDRDRTVVWVRGDHDIATRVHLSVTIAQAARLDDGDIIVDLSGVTFMDASAVGALVVAHNRLRARSRSLSVRAPSPRARRVLDLCGLAGLIDEQPSLAGPLAAPALGSWVDVPAAGSGPGALRPAASRKATSREPAHAAARPDGEAAAIVPPRPPS